MAFGCDRLLTIQYPILVNAKAPVIVPGLFVCGSQASTMSIKIGTVNNLLIDNMLAWSGMVL